MSVLELEEGTRVRASTADEMVDWGSGGGTQYAIRDGENLQKKTGQMEEGDLPGSWSEESLDLERVLNGEVDLASIEI